jgi:hypothetical protein
MTKPEKVQPLILPKEKPAEAGFWINCIKSTV